MISDSILNLIRASRNNVVRFTAKQKQSFQSLSEMRYDDAHVQHCLNKDSVLTSNEKRLIKEAYGKIIPNVKRGYKFFQALKHIDKFDVNYIPSSFYYPYLIQVLNPASYSKLLGHKGLLKSIYQSAINHPSTPLRSIGGIIFDENNYPVSSSDAAEILRGIGQAVLFKPATESNQGDGIKFFDESDIRDLCSYIETRQFLLNDNSDFVVQLPVKQSAETAVFNPTSLNCMRVTTLNLNGRVTTHSMTLKCGPANSKVDNIGTGERGIIVGIDSDGYLHEKGFYGNGKMAAEHNGIRFGGRKITAFPKVVEAALKLHSLVDSCHVIGWDLALDEDNNPVLIEGNTVYPGISFEQMCSGPLFGDRLDEVIDYVAEHRKYNNGW